MADGRERAEWGRLSALLAMLANCNRDPKKGRPLSPADMNPYTKIDGRQRSSAIDASTPEGKAMLKEAFSVFPRRKRRDKDTNPEPKGV